MEDILSYEEYHTHPVNKFIHFICIPVIIFSILTFTSHFNFKINRFRDDNDYITIRLDKLILIFYNTYYISYGPRIGTYMMIYNSLFYLLSRFIYYYKHIGHRKNLIIFLCAFTLQFIGHFIEGSRPAMFVGLKQTLLQAPLFNLNYIYPGLLSNY